MVLIYNLKIKYIMENLYQSIYHFIGEVVEQVGFLGLVIIVATLFLIFNAIFRGIKIKKARKYFRQQEKEYFDESEAYDD